MSDLDDQGLAGKRATKPPSRRSVLRAAAGAGAAGIAATTLGGMLAPASAATRTDTGAGSGAAVHDGANDVVLHVRNAAAGEIDIFHGTTQTRLRDRDLAARVVRAIR